MRKQFLLMVAVPLSTLSVSAEHYLDLQPMKLEVPEMKPELVELTHTPLNYFEAVAGTSVLMQPSVMPESTVGWQPDFDFFKSKTNPSVKEFKFMDDMTFVGVPLFVAGWAIKSDKAMFRVNNKDGKKNTQLLTDFKTGIDDYTQYFGPFMTVGMKLGGYEGRSDWPRLFASAAMSYGIMAAFVNGIKYSAKELRPDGSTRNSWPSGHTATSFVGATLLHKEYGLTRSPWFSVAGYGVATATGVMRVLNNRHWVSDVMSGAGIGIISTELGYALSDVLFKGKGLLRDNLDVDSENPSFFGISMGVGIGGKDIGFNLFTDMQDAEQHGISAELAELAAGMPEANVNIDFRASTVVDAEGAYFFNKYVGIGGRFRVRAMSAKSFGNYADISNEDANDVWLDDISAIYQVSDNPNAALTSALINQGGAPVTKMEGIVKSDHLAEFTGSVGLYFNLPLTHQLSLGTKFLIGRSMTQELDIDGHAEGNVKDINYGMTIVNGDVVQLALDNPTSTGETWTDDWDYLTLGAKSSTSYDTGLSLTYRYKSNFSFKLFVDYDYSKKTFTLMNDNYHFLKEGLTSKAYSLISNQQVSELVKTGTDEPFSITEQLNPYYFKKDKKMNYFTIGLSFAVNL